MLSFFSIPLLLLSGALAYGPGYHQRFASTRRSTPDVTQVDMVANSWYTGWDAADFPVNDVSWEKYTHITFAFASVTTIQYSHWALTYRLLL